MGIWLSCEGWLLDFSFVSLLAMPKSFPYAHWASYTMGVVTAVVLLDVG